MKVSTQPSDLQVSSTQLEHYTVIQGMFARAQISTSFEMERRLLRPVFPSFQMLTKMKIFMQCRGAPDSIFIS